MANAENTSTQVPAGIAGLVRSLALAFALAVVAGAVFNLSADSPTLDQARLAGLSAPIDCLDRGSARAVVRGAYMDAEQGLVHPCISTDLWQSFGEGAEAEQNAVVGTMGGLVGEVRTLCPELPDCSADAIADFVVPGLPPNIPADLAAEIEAADVFEVRGQELRVVRDVITQAWCVDSRNILHNECRIGNLRATGEVDDGAVVDLVSDVRVVAGVEESGDLLLSRIQVIVATDETVLLDGPPVVTTAPAGWAIEPAGAQIITPAGPVPLTGQAELTPDDQLQLLLIHTPSTPDDDVAGEIALESGPLSVELEVTGYRLFL